MWVVHSFVSFILPLIAVSQGPRVQGHYHEQSYQSPRDKQQMYGYGSCGEKVCATDGYQYASFENVCHLTEYNLKLLIAEQPEFIETDPFYCEQPQRALTYNRMPFDISSYSPYSPDVSRESAVMRNFKYRSNNIQLKYPTRNYYKYPVSRSFEHAAAQTSSIITTKLGHIGAQRTFYWRQPNENQHHSSYDQLAEQTISDTYPYYTNLAASQYPIAYSKINTYEPKAKPISANTTTRDPNTTTKPTTIAPNTTATSTMNPETTEATSTTFSPSTEENVTLTSITNSPNTTTISTRIIPNTTTPSGGINPASPPTTTDPNAIIATTIDPNITTIATTTSTTITPNITTISTTIVPNITTISTTTSLTTFNTTTSTTTFITSLPTTTASSTTASTTTASTNTAFTNAASTNTASTNTSSTNTASTNTASTNTASTNTASTNTASTNTASTNTASTNTASTNTASTSTVSTSTASTTTASTTTAPTTTSQTTTTPTTISPTTTRTTIGANGSAAIQPNKTIPTEITATAPPATTTTRLYSNNETATDSNDTIEPITITIQQSNGILLTFVLDPFGASGTGYSKCNPTSTVQITKGSQMLFKFTGCFKTSSTPSTKPTNVPMYRSPPAPNTNRSPYFYNPAPASGATCAHSYATRIFYNY